MTYYLEIRNNEIKGRCQCVCSGENVTCVEVTEEIYNNCFTYGYDFYSFINGEIIESPDYAAQQLELKRADKLEEALTKAYEYEQTGTVEFKNCEFEMSIANRNNLRDTVEALSALEQTATTWNDKNDELVVLTLEDIQYIRLNLILGAIQKLWIEDYPAYKQQILEAETMEQLEEIEIDYVGSNS